MSTFMTSRPTYLTKKIPAKLSKELKDFKLRVALGAHNVWQQGFNQSDESWRKAALPDESVMKSPGYSDWNFNINVKYFEVTIGNAHFKFYPGRDQDRIKKILSKFRTTVW